MLYFFIFGICMWVLGYYYTARKMSNTGRVDKDSEKIVSPPKWLYYLCGAPYSKDYPKGTMRILALKAQILGFTMAAYAIWDEIWKPPMMESAFGFVLSIIITLLLTNYVSKHYAVREPKRRK